ncbi:MAG: MBL fold metallo-hydrolase [Gammaproteobacteria bacterium]|nr:MBL fold metallo-hydrolase [Gammaproteobacteria bacterium]
MRLRFYGAAGEVTGSCHILEVGEQRILLDCGMIQGSARDEARNSNPFPFKLDDINAVVLSHAHVDHSGRLPLLVKRGYRGPIHAHRATRDLCRILLRDSASLAERDADYQNRRRARKGLQPIDVLYDKEDVDNCIKQFEVNGYEKPCEILPGITLCFHDAGHILGSCSVDLDITHQGHRRRIVFSGDLGQYDAPILEDPATLKDADLVLMESTYGGRRHRSHHETIKEIGEVIANAEHHRGNILIPAFALGRSQEVLYLLGKHYDEWGLERWRIFLDSPMAVEATQVYWDYPHLYDEDATNLRRQLEHMPVLRNLHLTRSPDESRMINRIENGAIIIAGSGMCTGGRILHHLKHNVWRKTAHIMIIGYQAPGTLGRRLVDGNQYVRIYGEAMRVNATVHTIGGLSAHGDEDDLARWFSSFSPPPHVCLVHGEDKAREAMAARLQREFAASTTIPGPGDVLTV